jgi:hypothetical protein
VNLWPEGLPDGVDFRRALALGEGLRRFTCGAPWRRGSTPQRRRVGGQCA